MCIFCPVVPSLSCLSPWQSRLPATRALIPKLSTHFGREINDSPIINDLIKFPRVARAAKRLNVIDRISSFHYGWDDMIYGQFDIRTLASQAGIIIPGL